MSLSEGEVAWYIDEYSDEIMPCKPSLEGWAVWLSKPDQEWGRDEAAADGDRFTASPIRFAADVVATRHAGGEWTLGRAIEGEPALLVCRFGPGIGWDPDNILWWESGATPEQAIREWPSPRA